MSRRAFRESHSRARARLRPSTLLQGARVFASRETRLASRHELIRLTHLPDALGPPCTAIARVGSRVCVIRTCVRTRALAHLYGRNWRVRERSYTRARAHTHTRTRTYLDVPFYSEPHDILESRRRQ